MHYTHCNLKDPIEWVCCLAFIPVLFLILLLTIMPWPFQVIQCIEANSDLLQFQWCLLNMTLPAQRTTFQTYGCLCWFVLLPYTDKVHIGLVTIPFLKSGQYISVGPVQNSHSLQPVMFSDHLTWLCFCSHQNPLHTTWARGFTVLFYMCNKYAVPNTVMHEMQLIVLAILVWACDRLKTTAITVQ